MPNRIIREGILTSEAVNSLSWQAEVFYRRLLSVADDYGRFHAHHSLLRAALYPLQLDKVSDADIGKWLRETEKAALVSVYSSSGKAYLEVSRFGQQIRAKESKFPPMLSTCLADDSTCSHMHTKAEAEAEAEAKAETKSIFGGGGGEVEPPLPPLPLNEPTNLETSVDLNELASALGRMAHQMREDEKLIWQSLKSRGCKIEDVRAARATFLSRNPPITKNKLGVPFVQERIMEEMSIRTAPKKEKSAYQSNMEALGRIGNGVKTSG